MTRRNARDGAETEGASISRDQFGGGPEACPSGIRHIGGAKPDQAFVQNVRTCRPDAKGGVQGPVMGLDRRGCVAQPMPQANRRREELWDKARPHDIRLRLSIGSRMK